MTDPQVRLIANNIAGLWSIQPSREQSLDDFTTALFDDTNQKASLAIGNGYYLLRAWPHQAYLLIDDPELPAAANPYQALMTDISDAYCAFLLEGETASDFIADYLSANIRQIAPGHHCLRCRLGHYTVLLWWQQRERLHLLVERSLASSFEDYIGRLALRRNHD